MGKQLVKIVKEICKEEKIKFKSYSDDYIIQLEANKELMYIFGNKFPNNNAAVEQICNDKAALSSILDYYGIPHVPHFYFNSPTVAYNNLSSGNWSKMKSLLKKYGVLVCKPNRGTGGNNIYKVTTQQDLESATQKIFNISNSMCISPYYNIKNEYRVVAVRDEFQYAFKKIRCYVIGNGKDNIYQLCNMFSNKSNLFNSNSIDWETIPAEGEKIELTWKHNLGQGAEPLLVTNENVKRKLIDLARKCVGVLNTGFVSIDIVETDNDLNILEINSGVMVEKFSEFSAENYNLAKEAIRKAIKDFMKLNIKYNLTRQRKSRFVLPVLIKIAKKRNIQIIEDKEENNFAIFLFNNGKSFVAKDYPFNINQGGTISLCSNKSACNSLVYTLGYNVPKEKYFVRKSNVMISIKEIEKHLDNPEKNLGFNYPIVIKPNNLAQGECVNVAYSRSECIRYAQEAFLKSKIILLQEYCSGNEYRVVVLNGRVIQAYQRIAFCIKGDGHSTIYDLIINKVALFKKYGRDKDVDINDPRILLHIIREGYTMDSILEHDKTLKLQDIANLSLGGESVDVIDIIDKKFEELVIKLAKSFNLLLCGIDIIAKDISNFDLGYYVLEINSSPGLDNYLYPKEEQVKYVESLYSEILDELCN